MRKKLRILLAALTLLLSFSAFPSASASAPAWQEYNGKRIGVLVGPLMEDIAHANFPDSEYLLFNSYPDCIAALLSGKIDAYLGDEPELRTVHAEQPRIDYIPEPIATQNYSFAFRKNDPASAALCAELNAFLARSHADGTMDELNEIWFGEDEERKVVDMSGLDGKNGTIRVVTTSTDMPFSYIKDGKNVGYDIDLVVRFCRSAGYALELGDVDFSARISAVQSGKYDFTTDMNVTPEREEQVLFSDPTSSGSVVLAILAPEASAAASAAPDWQAFRGKRIGVQTGTISGEVAQSVIPEVELSYFNTQTDILAALRANKIDAWCTDEPILRYVALGNPDVALVEGMLDESSLAAVFPKTDEGLALRDQYSAFVDSLWADGTMEEIDRVWFSSDESRYTVLDYAALPDTNGTLRLALDTSLLPFAFVKDGQIVGYDVDIAARFCEANGYRLEILPMNFEGVLPTLQTGKADFAACGITVTEERAESLYFSSATYRSGTTLALRSTDDAGTSGLAYTSLSQLETGRIGIPSGTSFDLMVAARFPRAQLSYYNNQTDLLAALSAGKIDAFPSDEPVIRYIMSQRGDVGYIPEYLDTFDFAYCFPKTEEGERLCGQMSEFLRKLKESGELDALRDKWFGGDESAKTLPDLASLPAPNGVLRMATDGDYMPFEYIRDGEPVGYDVDLAALFCQAYGYGLEIEIMNLDAVLPAVQSGKCSFGGSALTITPERAESVLFSAPNYSGGTVLAVLKGPSAAVAPAEGFWAGVAASFQKTFLRENRWLLFLEGVGNTLLITLLTILFGTALGFGVFLLCRKGNPVANGLTRFSMWLVQGTPMVVLLMILYYLIFGRVAISGIAVAVIGFSLTFGAAVLGLLKMGVSAVDRGQQEAAWALGHSDGATFFRIILPQAIPHVLPAYQGEIVGLIKATAIVGYIAVQDLTKMGDIVRSRTYEAFFPLIAIAVIYFMLEALFSFLVSRIRVSIDPKKRRRDRILKGVKTHD